MKAPLGRIEPAASALFGGLRDERRRAAVFLDREGTLLDNSAGHVTSFRDVSFLRTALSALRLLATSGLAIVIATNQSPVGRGMITESDAWALNGAICDEITRAGGRVDATFMCPHRSGDGCACRKPKPGLLLAAATALDLDLRRSFVVGDSAGDVGAALAVGASPILVQTGNGAAAALELASRRASSLTVVADILSAAELIVERTGAATTIGRTPSYRESGYPR